MSTGAVQNWQREFGLEEKRPPTFFSNLEDVNTAGSKAPQPHVLRRAFEYLKLDGILCQDKAPVIYFRVIEQIDNDTVMELHRRFWNQGVAPILVLIAPKEIHIYSGLSQPSDPGASTATGFVEKLGRVTNELQKFIIAVESGEYFHKHRRSFNPKQRVDRNLLRHLQAARERLDEVQNNGRLEPYTLDALLCRLVFTCYLFDRKIIDQKYLKNIDIHDAEHLRDILARKPKNEAKTNLYKLFAQLGQDFNGDLFSDDLEAEARQIKAGHLDILNGFFHGTDPITGQQSFWPYDFEIIPIETISAIYEHFLKIAGEKEKKKAGVFFTPRFLAEIVLDRDLYGVKSLLGKRFLDPACGSGIFLVGLFNRLAEEWSQANPGAEYDAKLKGLTQILKTSLFGIDKDRTACLITAFSLYLALLDQISPPDIRKVLRKQVLPHLISGGKDHAATIRCADFFTNEAELPEKMNFVIGNPPWGSISGSETPADKWCSDRNLPFPDRQIATAFVWKAPHHLEPNGRVCFVLPYGVLFNHSKAAIEFQKEWIIRHVLDNVLNLADLRWFLFEEAVHPALVVRYGKEPPADSHDRINYLAPKTDWTVAQAELISVLPQDRSRLTIRELLDNLNGDDAPCIWKEQFWATPRDRRLLDRLFLFPRLRDLIGRSSGKHGKRWIIGQGFEERSEETSETKKLLLPTRTIIEATSQSLHLFILQEDCKILSSNEIIVRKRSNTHTNVYRGPHVLVTKGLKRSAFADFDVSFRHALRGIHGPKEDRKLLLFLAAYLQTSLAQFFLFHTSSNWGVYRDEVHVAELLRLPFPLPDQTHNPKRSKQIVDEIARLVTDAANQASKTFIDRQDIVRQAVSTAEKLIEEYFDIDDIERILISDTMNIIIPSIQPARTAVDIPSIKQATEEQREEYTRFLCETLNNWASKEYRVYGKSVLDGAIGVGMVVLEKTRRGENTSHLDGPTKEILKTLHSLQRGAASRSSTLELVRGLKVFDKTLLYITKPIGQRFWSRTAALNDADEIAGTILMRPAKGDA